jgi:hypothetical protein
LAYTDARYQARLAIESRIEVAPAEICMRSAYSHTWNDGRRDIRIRAQGKAAQEIEALYKCVIQVYI